MLEDLSFEWYRYSLYCDTGFLRERCQILLLTVLAWCLDLSSSSLVMLMFIIVMAAVFGLTQNVLSLVCSTLQVLIDDLVEIVAGDLG